ncbi:MAG TPA: methyltransferase domain-containing protein [Actinomycetota bacterium]|jgi:uncharacterized protein YbaR (Trm112 family)|nr:methyltransferase domain-containing protein [Actinomycetota bacterium]
MNRALLQWLCCPVCRASSLALFEEADEDGEVITGVLSCSECQAGYEIRNGIPFLLPQDLQARLDLRLSDADERDFAAYRTDATPAVRAVLAGLARDSRVVLDIGSGRSPYRDLFRGDLVCVDLYPPFLSELRAAVTPGLRVHSVCASATHLPFQDGFADLVFASEVIEHLSPSDAQDAMHSWPRLAKKWCVIDTLNGTERAVITRLRYLIYRTQSLTGVTHPNLPELDHHSTFSPETFRTAGYECHGCIGWVSRQRFRLGKLWDLYDAVAWRVPSIGGTLIAIAPGSGPTADASRDDRASSVRHDPR